MSSPKRFCTSHDGTTAVEPPPPPIPVDLLLEILARVDVATVVRCAATSKTVRRAILGDPTIGRRVEANGALLLGVSYAISEFEIDRDIRVSFVGQAPRQNHLGFDAGRKLRCSEPVASRGGLIVLLERRSYPWNTVTRSIQWVQLPTANVATAGCYPSYALVTVGDAGRSFQLLVVTSSWPRPSMSLRTQIYSKDDGRWGPVTEITDLPRELELTRYALSRRPEALVLGGGTAVHWLHNYSGWCIVRLDIDEAKPTLITLPPECVHQSVDELQLAASTDGKLSLVVAEYCVISMWTLSAATPGEGASARWTRQVVIRREGISRAPTGRYKNHRDLFLGFGELSSTVVLLMHHIGLVRINLRTKEALVLGSDDEFKEIEAAHDGFNKIEACLHEIDLPSILLAMKPY